MIKIITSVQQILTTRNLLIMMVVLQLLWLAGIWVTGATARTDKLLVLVIYTATTGLAVGLMPTRLEAKLKQLRSRFIQNEQYFLLALCLVALVVGVIYALVQRVWPYDEENNYITAQLIATQGVGPFFEQYAQIPWLGSQHPPLVPLMFGFSMVPLGTSLFAIRLVALALMLGILVITYMLGRQLYDSSTGALAGLFLLSFPLILRQGTVAMTDIPLTFLFSLALLLSICLWHRPSLWLAVITGLIIGLGLLSKYIMVFIFGVLTVYLLINRSFRSFKYYLALSFGISLVVLAIWIFYAARIGVLEAQIEKIVAYSGVQYLAQDVISQSKAAFSSSDQSSSPEQHGFAFLRSGIAQQGLETLTTRLPSAIGVYHIPLLGLGLWMACRRRNSSDLFLVLWIGVVSLALFLTLPDHRYFMPTFPALAILMAYALQHIQVSVERITALSLLFWGGSLYLFADWFRETHLFLLK